MDEATEIKRGLYPSWAEVPMAGWRWPNFTPRELACKCGGRFCGGEYFHDPEFLDNLQGLREDMGAPLVITSGRRCDRHNTRVGGASRSQHKLAIAGDVSLFGHDEADLARKAVARGFRGVGFGSSFLHLDMRVTRTAFHYANGVNRWVVVFGFDPVERLKARWAL